MRLLNEFCPGVIFFPVLPDISFRADFWKPPLEINALNPQQPFVAGIPKRPGFFVVQDEGPLVRLRMLLSYWSFERPDPYNFKRRKDPRNDRCFGGKGFRLKGDGVNAR